VTALLEYFDLAMLKISGGGSKAPFDPPPLYPSLLAVVAGRQIMKQKLEFWCLMPVCQPAYMFCCNQM